MEKLGPSLLYDVKATLPWKSSAFSLFLAWTEALTQAGKLTWCGSRGLFWGEFVAHSREDQVLHLQSINLTVESGISHCSIGGGLKTLHQTAEEPRLLRWGRVWAPFFWTSPQPAQSSTRTRRQTHVFISKTRLLITLLKIVEAGRVVLLISHLNSECRLGKMTGHWNRLYF